MSATGPHDFLYVQSDIPEGMTIREWRAHRAAERAEAEATAKAEHRARRRAVLMRAVAAVSIHLRQARFRSRAAHP